jgi:hypothetical protein
VASAAKSAHAQASSVIGTLSKANEGANPARDSVTGV